MVLSKGYRFLIVGTMTVIIDFSVYQSLRCCELLDINMAKLSGFIAGTIFSYIANKSWTFRKNFNDDVAKSVPLFFILYACTMWVNVSVNAFVLQKIIYVPFSVWLAFLIATIVSALINFFGMKHFVFK